MNLCCYRRDKGMLLPYLHLICRPDSVLWPQTQTIARSPSFSIRPQSSACRPCMQPEIKSNERRDQLRKKCFCFLLLHSTTRCLIYSTQASFSPGRKFQGQYYLTYSNFNSLFLKWDMQTDAAHRSSWKPREVSPTAVIAYRKLGGNDHYKNVEVLCFHRNR